MRSSGTYIEINCHFPWAVGQLGNLENMGTLSDLYAVARRIILELREGLERVERLEAASPNVSFSTRVTSCFIGWIHAGSCEPEK